MPRGIFSPDKRELKGSRKRFVHGPTQIWIDWMKENLTYEYQYSPDVYRQGVKHNVEMINGFKSALREMIRTGDVEIETVMIGHGTSSRSTRYRIRKPAPKPQPILVKSTHATGLDDDGDDHTYTGALMRKLTYIEGRQDKLIHQMDQLSTAVSALLQAFKQHRGSMRYIAYENSFTYGIVRHEFEDHAAREAWLEETKGLTLASEGGREYLHPAQERKHMDCPVVIHRLRTQENACLPISFRPTVATPTR